MFAVQYVHFLTFGSKRQRIAGLERRGCSLRIDQFGPLFCGGFRKQPVPWRLHESRVAVIGIAIRVSIEWITWSASQRPRRWLEDGRRKRPHYGPPPEAAPPSES